MSGGDEHVYKDGRAVWEAATTRAKTIAKATGQDAGALLSRFVFGRFLARVFSSPASLWVLKGGNAVLVRVHDARATTDIDLFHQLKDLDVAIAALRRATDLDLGDHFRFVITKVDTEVGGTAQPNVAGAQLHLDAYVGTRKINGFHVDLATGSLMTAEPQVRPAISIDLPGITPATVRLYPVVDHVADKLCAMQALYGQDQRPSSRHRDLVDLVVFALTEDMDGNQLTTALLGEWAHRQMAGEPRFDPPAGFERGYPPIARKVPRCAGHTAYADAVALVSTMLTPPLTATAAGRRWTASDLSWHPATQ